MTRPATGTPEYHEWLSHRPNLRSGDDPDSGVVVTLDGITSGLTAPHWEPTEETRYFAQRPESDVPYFGRTRQAAVDALRAAPAADSPGPAA